LLGGAFLGCPQTLVKRIEELRPPPGYRPVVADTTLSISADALMVRAHAMDSVRMTHDTYQSIHTSTRDSSDHSVQGGCLVQLHPRQLDDGRYPDEIVFDVTVTDDAGRMVTGLAPPHYRGAVPWRAVWSWLSDSCKGTTFRIDSFTVEERRQERSERFAVAFVLDHSPSMGQARIIRLRQAIAGVLNEFIPGDAVTIISFGSKSRVEVPITADSGAYWAFNPTSGEAIGGTAIYDAIVTAVEQLRKTPPDNQRIIVLFTDGEDNSSKISLQAAVRRALEGGVTIYTIAYGWISEEPLRLIAQGTHGQMYRIYSIREFPSIFSRIYRALRNYYRIRYRPPQCDGLHTVRVGVQLASCLSSATASYDRSVLTALDTVGTTVFLPIEFDFDQATIRPESIPLVERIADAMKAHPSLVIEVRGHTDDRGSDSYNQRLSQRRAEAVVETLASMGVERSRLRAVGFGKSRPLVPNTSEENRARNRRTEFVVIRN
jgi:outer membrane protein OmpA-like peptidoglycan-associated protein/Mg-chelatase subunit ChlD